jgi:DNA-binding MarR family transcriptional regulator
MDAAVIDIVLRFQRAVAPGMELLDDVYRRSGRSAGQNRLLLAIAADGTEVRTIRSQLSLDSGYLSRLLRALEREKLVRLVESATDRRVRTVQLTDQGRRERARLAEATYHAARSMMAPLSPAQRSRLVAAMSAVNEIWA